MYFGINSKYHLALHAHFKCHDSNNEASFFFLPCCNEGTKLATEGCPNTRCTSASELKMNIQPGSSFSPKVSPHSVILVLLGGGACVPEEETYK